MEQLTKNFHRSEFDCKDNTRVPEEFKNNLIKLATNLQIIRDELGSPISINSGYRTESHNKKENGAKNSQHLYAKAGDLRQSKLTPLQFYRFIENLIKLGLIYNGGLFLYDTFVHYDIGNPNRRGNYSKKFIL